MPNRIREIRELRGLSQQQLAEAADTSQPQIDRLEKGERRLTQDWMTRLAGALNVEAADLLMPKAGGAKLGLKALRKRVGLSQAEVAREIGVPTDDYVAWEEKRASIPSNLAGPLGDVFASRGVPSHDLVTLAGIERSGGQAPGAGAARPRLGELAETIMVPELDVRASAGGGALDQEEAVIAEWQIPSAVIQEMAPGPEPHLKIIRFVGDSMDPEYPPNTRGLVNINDTLPTPPGIFVVWDGIGRVVKRVEHIPHSEPPTVEISSINPAYKPYRRTLEEAHILGRVIGRWKAT